MNGKMMMKWFSESLTGKSNKLIYLLFLLGCESNGFSPYAYGQDLEYYLKELNVQVTTAQVLLLPLDSCGLCVDEVLEQLVKTEHEISVVLSGNVVSKDRLEKSKRLISKTNLKIVIDENNLMKSYDLNAFSPVLINVSAKKYSYVSLSLQNAATYL
ncbi:hypothetical protein [Mongoliitalea lutea]|uniref:Uncharacterized protein n=1 Tax=Mongoliitalea lutea TaxID=849756 RepID=A0A8J3G5K0_9BACT|nr:hypothetical protein [Mongoliitalea lutea]GHB37660.1 hypothetical protein GCM10008106_18610 [Mongoliitalea lutea]